MTIVTESIAYSTEPITYEIDGFAAEATMESGMATVQHWTNR